MAAKTWSRTVGDVNWSTGANWNGGTVPATVDVVTFDGTSVLACTVDALGTFTGQIIVAAGYTGGTAIITQNVAIPSTAAFSIADGTWVQAAAITRTTFAVTGGTFTGGSQSISITGTLTFSGGTLTMTSGTCTISAGSFTQTNTPTFNANGGTIAFTGGTAMTLTGPNCTFNIVTFNKGAVNVTIAAGTTCPLGTNPDVIVTSPGTFLVNGTLTWTNQLTLNCIFNTAATTVLTNNGTLGITPNLNMTFHASATITASIPLTITSSAGACTITATAYTFATSTVNRTGGTGALTIAAGTTLPVGANPTLTSAGSITVSGALSGSGLLTVDLTSGSSLTFSVGAAGDISDFTDYLGINTNGNTFNATSDTGAALNITLHSTGAEVATLTGGDKTYGFIKFTGTSTGGRSILDSNTFTYIQDNDPTMAAHELSFQASQTTTLTDAQPFRVRGTATAVITVNSTTSTNSVLTATNAAAYISCRYLFVDDVTVDAGPPVWYAGANSTSSGDAPNWVFTNNPADVKRRISMRIMS